MLKQTEKKSKDARILAHFIRKSKHYRAVWGQLPADVVAFRSLWLAAKSAVDAEDAEARGNFPDTRVDRCTSNSTHAASRAWAQTVIGS